MTVTAETYRCIGKGCCGSVWAADVDDEYAMKSEDGGPGRSLAHDWQMHNIIHNSVRIFKSRRRLDLNIPQPHALVSGQNDDWWSEHASKFPPGFTQCTTLISTKIPAFPASIRERIISRYCPIELVDGVKLKPSEEDCLVRLYLGKRRNGRRMSRSRAFSLRNYPLYINQMEELRMDVFRYAEVLADALAMLHWVARVDANGVEFVLAPSSRHDTGDIPTSFYCDFLGNHSLWILDFDCCRPMQLNELGVSQAVAAFFDNDPFFPRPGFMAAARD